MLEVLQRIVQEVNASPDLGKAQISLPGLLIGVDNLSMSAGSLLQVKKGGGLRRISRARARQLLQKALRYEDAASVQRLMYKTLENMGLGGLIRPGR
ncbi:MAG: hypothetical protein L3J26_08710 [Candidatus Polarisedimenticolaceae bacterium]|nr:hypothetical protein [Candidatus Polarisedimenticolaceae bacterium]